VGTSCFAFGARSQEEKALGVPFDGFSSLELLNRKTDSEPPDRHIAIKLPIQHRKWWGGGGGKEEKIWVEARST